MQFKGDRTLKYKLQSIMFVLVAFMLGCNEYMVVAVLENISADLKIQIFLLGILVTVFAFVYSICTPIISIVFAHVKRHLVLFGLLVVFIIANTLTALAPNFYVLIISRILSGATAGSIISITIIMTNFIAPAEKRAGLISWVYSGAGIANLLGVPVGNKIAEIFSWRYSFAIITILSVIVLLLLISLAPRNTPQITAKNTSKNTESIHNTDKQDFIKDIRVILTCAFIVFACAAQFSYYTYITKLLTKYMKFSPASVSTLLFILGVVAIIGTKLGGFFADHGNMKNMPYLYLFMTPALIIVGLTMHIKILAFVLVALMVIVSNSFGSSVTVYLLDIANNHYPDALDLASSLTPVFSNVGIAIGSLASSLAIPYLTLGHVVFVSAVFAALSLITTVLQLKQKHI